MKSERMARRASFGNLVLKKLSDITNLQNVKVSTTEEKPPEMSDIDKDYVDQLIKERRNLMKHIAERNQIIELTGAELQNLRVSLQKLQLQNWNLAQSNSHMIAELNFGRERVKALQHELVCKEALLKAKSFVKEGKSNGNCQKTGFKDEKETSLNVSETNETERLRGQNRRRTIRSRSMGPSMEKSVKTEDKEKAENKRRCLKRQSARCKSHEKEQLDNYFELEDTKLPPNNNQNINYRIGEEVEDEEEEIRVSQRPSIGRPLRRAVGKVQSYKEIPINIKMRRHQ